MRFRRSRLTDEQTRRLLEHFVAGTPARTAAELAGVNRNTARVFYHRLRQLIAQHVERDSPIQGEYAAGRQEASEQHAGEPGSGPVFGLVKRGDKVYTIMLPDARRESSAEAATTIEPDSIVYAETPGPEAVLDVSAFRFQRVPRRARLAHARGNISSTENFWNQTKRQLRRYNGVPQRHFYLFLKECEWRYNYGPPHQLLRTLTRWMESDPP